VRRARPCRAWRGQFHDSSRHKSVLWPVRYPHLFSILSDRPLLTYYLAVYFRLKRLDVEAAKKDLEIRTLAPMGYDFARIVYLSSLRDFSTGDYHHDGLARSFSKSAASAALIAAHQEAFYHLTLAPIECFVAQVERFIRSSPRDYASSLHAWETLEGYRVTVPSACDQLTSALFRSNVKIAITLLKSRRSIPPQPWPPSSPPQLPAR
jgi:hypothetical protein